MKKYICIFTLGFMFSLLLAADKPGLKVFISADMEGISGVVHAEQTVPENRDFGAARKWMAEDVNAVVAGAIEAGATEVVVCDSHGFMRNILPDDLHPKASLVSGTPKPLAMMQGIDRSFDACIFVGYHAQAGTAAAILDHTISGGTVYAIRVNGQELPEMGLNAAIAGYFGVPVVMLSGDAAACAQAKALLGNEVVTVAVKEGIGRSAAKLLPLTEARRQLKEAAKAAVLGRTGIKPFVLKPPFQFELDFLNSGQAEAAEGLPMVQRTHARGVRFSAGDYLEGFKILRALIALAAAR
jgi:D-amino peptidase